ncbi:MAG TPA: DUF1028 domain-containing protein [Saprospiraceae bacterium]|nr:DUF1028 domain-containing protein [Saprospiraceae bacterium]HMP13097.1 DUF1028 domain-containing protein [Saprospiraceae bacterium]
MKRCPLLITAVLLCLSLRVFTQSIYGHQPLVHTYSIVAYDPATGDMGVAVQSHWFSVGTVVIWGEPGTGVIATQSFANPAYGTEGLALLKQGFSAQQTMEQLLKADDGRAFRQVGIVDARGNAAAFTGDKCIAEAGHYVGAGFAVQANMMLNEAVWPAMARAFEGSKGQPLAERMVAALEAAQRSGGDIRGQQSAALLVVSANNTGQLWVDRKVDLRVDDHATPIAELRRLLQLHRAYEHMNAGDVEMEHGNVEKALDHYLTANMMFPANEEMKFWRAVNLANLGRMSEAKSIFQEVFRKNENWRVLLQRIRQNGILTVKDDDLNSILSASR